MQSQIITVIQSNPAGKKNAVIERFLALTRAFV